MGCVIQLRADCRPFLVSNLRSCSCARICVTSARPMSYSLLGERSFAARRWWVPMWHYASTMVGVSWERSGNYLGTLGFLVTRGCVFNLESCLWAATCSPPSVWCVLLFALLFCSVTLRLLTCRVMWDRRTDYA